MTWGRPKPLGGIQGSRVEPGHGVPYRRFPDGRGDPLGGSYLPGPGHPGFTVIIANWHTVDTADTFWHELGHCLLNTRPGDVVDGKHEDHDHDFMFRPEPKNLRISPAVGKRMRDTALNVLT